jgi:type VI secretion system secreted protein VgrG
LHVDKYGRVKVQFHWDRRGQRDEHSSCWIRVARDWAGKNWGTIFHPRVGHEVIVQFIEGDVDKPIVTGSVYNGDNMPPYALPGNRTKSAIKSRSSYGGADENCNEIRFEDKKGSEHFLIHAEKDHMVEVENDEMHTVGNNRNTTVKKDESVSITDNRSQAIGKKDTLQIGKEWIVNAEEKILIKCGAASISMKKDGTIEIAGKDIKVTGSGKINVKASSDLDLKGKKIYENRP